MFIFTGTINHLLPIEYNPHPTSAGVCIKCIFLNSSATDCLAVVGLRSSSQSGLTNIESSHKFTRSGDDASGCIEGINQNDHIIGVIEGSRHKETVTEDVDSNFISMYGMIE